MRLSPLLTKRPYNKMRNKKDDSITITKVEAPREKLDKFLDILVDFEEFPDLFLDSLENKKKLKIHKRNRKFDYDSFHKKERERKFISMSAEQIITMKSPPLSVSKKRVSSVVKKSPKNLEEKLRIIHKKAPSPPDSVKSSPVATPVETVPELCASRLIADPIVVKSPVKSFLKSSINNGNEISSIKIIKSPTKNWENSPARKEFFPDTEDEFSYQNEEDKNDVESPVASVICSPISATVISEYNNKKIENEKQGGERSPPSYYKSPVSLKTSINSQKNIDSFKSSIVLGESAASRIPPVIPKSKESDRISKIYDKYRGSVIRSKRQSFVSETASSTKTSSNPGSVADSIAYSIKEDDEKRELLFKFQLLANKHPEVALKCPFTMRSDIKVMRNTYAMILKQISVKTRVDNFQTYLLAGFMASEYLLGKIGFDMEGFSRNQIASMKSYESLLVELGEKEYNPCGMKEWCVEVRLMTTLAFNAVWFIVAKSISKKTNFDIMGMMNTMTADSKKSSTPPPQVILGGNAKQSAMKGPRHLID